MVSKWKIIHRQLIFYFHFYGCGKNALRESNQPRVYFSSILQVTFYHCGKAKVVAGTRIASTVKSREIMVEFMPVCLCMA